MAVVPWLRDMVKPAGIAGLGLDRLRYGERFDHRGRFGRHRQERCGGPRLDTRRHVVTNEQAYGRRVEVLLMFLN